jgi:hypothetical protein
VYVGRDASMDTHSFRQAAASPDAPQSKVSFVLFLDHTV